MSGYVTIDTSKIGVAPGQPTSPNGYVSVRTGKLPANFASLQPQAAMALISSTVHNDTLASAQQGLSKVLQGWGIPSDVPHDAMARLSYVNPMFQPFAYWLVAQQRAGTGAGLFREGTIPSKNQTLGKPYDPLNLSDFFLRVEPGQIVVRSSMLDLLKEGKAQPGFVEPRLTIPLYGGGGIPLPAVHGAAAVPAHPQDPNYQRAAVAYAYIKYLFPNAQILSESGGTVGRLMHASQKLENVISTPFGLGLQDIGAAVSRVPGFEVKTWNPKTKTAETTPIPFANPGTMWHQHLTDQGVSFGRDFAVAAGMHPSDPGYSMFVGAGAFLSNWYFNPLIIAGKFSSGIRLAQDLPRLESTADTYKMLSGKPLLTQMTYMALAKTPDELILNTPFGAKRVEQGLKIAKNGLARGSTDVIAADLRKAWGLTTGQAEMLSKFTDPNDFALRLADAFHPAEGVNVEATQARIRELQDELKAGDKALSSPGAVDIAIDDHVTRQQYLVAKIKELEAQTHVPEGSAITPLHYVPKASFPRRVFASLEAHVAAGHPEVAPLLAETPEEGFGFIGRDSAPTQARVFLGDKGVKTSDMTTEQVLAEAKKRGFTPVEKPTTAAPSPVSQPGFVGRTVQKYAYSPLSALRVPGTRLNAERWVQKLWDRTVHDWTQYDQWDKREQSLQNLEGFLAGAGVSPFARRELIAKAIGFKQGDMGALDHFMKHDIVDAVEAVPRPSWYRRSLLRYFDTQRQEFFSVVRKPFLDESSGRHVMRTDSVWSDAHEMPLADQPAHFANAYILPGHEDVLDNTGLWRQILQQKGWEAKNGDQKTLLDTWHKWQHFEDVATSIWRGLILLPRAPAVGMRIGLEESLALAGFDKASILSHPVRWLGYMIGRYGRNEADHLLGDDPYGALGNMGLRVQADIIDRGNVFDARSYVTNPMGKDVNGYLDRKQTVALHLLADQNMTRAALTLSPTRFVAWLKTSPEGKGMRSVIERGGEKGVVAPLEQNYKDYARAFQGKVEDFVGGRDDVRRALLAGDGLVHRADVEGILKGVQDSYKLADDLRAQAAALEGTTEDLVTRAKKGSRPEQYKDSAGVWQAMPAMAQNVERTPQEIAGALRQEAGWIEAEAKRDFMKYATKRTRVKGEVVSPAATGPIFDHRLDGGINEKNLRKAIESNDIPTLTREFPGWAAKEAIVDMRSPEFKNLMREWVKGNFDHDGNWSGETWNTSPTAAGPIHDTLFGRNDQRGAVQWMYHTLLNVPNFKLVKLPFYRQLFDEYKTLYMGRGYSEVRAAEFASADAAAQMTKIHYQLGEKTSSQYFFRHAFPFMPAYQSIFKRWMWTIPKYRGGIGIGNLYLLERAHTIDNAFKNFGIDVKNPWNIVFLGPLLAWMLPGQMHDAGFQLDPKGLNLALQGPLPGMGLPLAFATGLAAQHFKKLQPVVDTLASHYDISAIPTPLARIIEGFTGHPLSLDYLDGDTHDAMYASAKDNAMRQAYTEMNKEGLHAPNFDDPKYIASTDKNYNRQLPPPALQKKQNALDAKFAADTKAYMTEWYNRATTMTRTWSIYRGLAGLVMPAPVYITTRYQQSLSTLYQKLAGVAKGSAEADQMYQSWLADHPWGEMYLQSKTVWTDPTVPKPAATFDANSYAAYVKDLKAGLIRVRDPKEFAAVAMGYVARAQFQHRLTSTLGAIGDWTSQLRDWTDRTAAVQTYRRDWNSYLSVNTMFAGYYKTDTAAKKQDYVLGRYYDAYETLASAQSLFNENGITSRDYKTVKSTIAHALGDAIDSADQTGNSALSRAAANTKWWFDNVFTPTGDKLDKLYAQARAASVVGNQDARAAAYAQIKQLLDSQVPIKHDGAVAPTFQEWQWGAKTSNEKTVALATWTLDKPEWLTTFQRSKVGYPSGGGAEQFSNYIESYDAKYYAERAHIRDTVHTGQTKALDNLEAQRTAHLTQAAARFGSGAQKLWRLSDATPAQRLNQTGFFQGTASFPSLLKKADSIGSALRAAGLKITSEASSTYPAKQKKLQFYNVVQSAYLTDPNFRHDIDWLALSQTDNPNKPIPLAQLYAQVFFGEYPFVIGVQADLSRSKGSPRSYGRPPAASGGGGGGTGYTTITTGGG